MTLDKRLEILQNEYDNMRKYYDICIKPESTLNYSSLDYDRENMLLRKIQETKDWMKGKHLKLMEWKLKN